MFEVRVDGQTAMIAEGDAIGPLGELIAAVLREGDAEGLGLADEPGD